MIIAGVGLSFHLVSGLFIHELSVVALWQGLVEHYYRARGTALPEPAFMDVQVFRFAVADTTRHYHLPVKLTPWGLSCFRGA